MQVEAIQEPATLTAAELESLRVLVVDDEHIICETLELYLQHLGIKNVQTANNGLEALEKINKTKYDFVFVDLMMPEMNGIEVLKKTNDSHILTTFILMTGYPTMDVVIDAMHNGASDFLVKPFRFDDVKLAMERIQRLHCLMERNWQLHQELEKKKEVEELNNQLEKKIRLQTILYQIVDSLSKINRSENLYRYVINKAIESCNAKKACFLIYDLENSHLITLAQLGIEDMKPGTQAEFRHTRDGNTILGNTFIEDYFGTLGGKEVALDKTFRDKAFMATPFNIRKEPFGVLILGDKEGHKFFDGEDEFILKFLAEKAALNIENMALYDNIKQSFFASLMALVSAIEAKDAYTRQHSKRVTEYALMIARQMGCSQVDLDRIETSGPLHDIGKIGVQDNILNKPGRLTDDEFDHIKAHPLVGANIVAPLGLDSEEMGIIRHHHERWDGRGYPDHLEKEEIPRLARILAVADAFDAMNSNRAYRKALPFSVCIEELEKNRGSQFDPDVVESALIVLKDA